MSERITQKDLQDLVDIINKLTGMPLKPYQDEIDPVEKRYMPNAGNYHLSYAYGGVKLERMSLIPGSTSVSVISTGGYGTKRELYNWLNAFIDGLETGKALENES